MNHIPCVFINLTKRDDRLELCKEELKKLNYTFGENCFRFCAVDLPNNPAAGCSLSHLKCIELARTNKWPQVFICEDDIEILDASTFLQQWTNFSQYQSEWDVLLVAGNNFMPFYVTQDPILQSCCIKIGNCRTSTGYVVQEHYYDTMIQNIREGVTELLNQPEETTKFCIDMYWNTLQTNHMWFLLVPIVATQREDYSDIQKKVTNYSNLMLNHLKAIRDDDSLEYK